MGRIKILIVEDEKNIHDMYSASLGQDMFEARFAFNGKDALEIYQAWHPDIIVLDIWMPIMTGYLVLQEIRNTLNDVSTTIIMSTSASNSHDIKDCIKFGIQGYILKPFKLEEVGNKIVHYFQQKQATQLP
jgi:DNA-binding response OmpR family regulator